MRVESDDRYPRVVPDPPEAAGRFDTMLAVAVWLVVGLAAWYFGWHLVRWLLA